MLPRGRLMWRDEFDGPEIDSSKWQYENGPSKADEQNGTSEADELQTYVGPDPDTARIEDGVLVITARQQAAGIVSARLSTRGRFNFTYGVLEARMQVPVVQGFRPALWMLGTSLPDEGWPGCGEVGIMEVSGTRRGSASCATVHNRAHSSGAPKVDKWPTSGRLCSHLHDRGCARRAAAREVTGSPWSQRPNLSLQPLQTRATLSTVAASGSTKRLQGSGGARHRCACTAAALQSRVGSGGAVSLARALNRQPPPTPSPLPGAAPWPVAWRRLGACGSCSGRR